MGLNPTDNVTGWSQSVVGTHYPTDRAAVEELVAQARAAGTPLYPISTGLNFGYGGASPPRPGCALVDLSRMNRILNEDDISLENPVALIEPGVTQAQLYDVLKKKCPGLTFNVTGSARHTSILGNALERGVGYFGPRREDLFGLEVVCGSGKVLTTGFRRLGEDSPLAHCHPYGLGPMLDGLFFQGNFGIVTSACFRLVPRRPCQAALSMSLRDEAHLPAFIDELAALKREGLVESVTHIGNRSRTHATLTYGVTRYLEQSCRYSAADAAVEAASVLDLVAPGEWTSLSAITGTRAQIRANLAEVRRRMRRIARVMVVTQKKLDVGYAVMHALRRLPFARANAAAIAAIRPLHVLTMGEPTDAAIDNLLWAFGRAELPATKLDQSRCGLLFINPALPLRGAFVTEVIAELKDIAHCHRHKLYITINIETATSMAAVINLLFDRDVPEQVERARACAAQMLACIRKKGLEVYRARADMMEDITDPASPYWTTVKGLKAELDPDDIIAPGRYNL